MDPRADRMNLSSDDIANRCVSREGVYAAGSMNPVETSSSAITCLTKLSKVKNGARMISQILMCRLPLDKSTSSR